VVAVASAESVGSAMHPQVMEALGFSAWALHRRAGTAAGAVPSAAPGVSEAAAGAAQGRAVDCPCRANQAARGVGAGSRARFCLMPPVFHRRPSTIGDGRGGAHYPDM
jgi:hypothetical protein